jgi:hypothetical protein
MYKCMYTYKEENDRRGDARAERRETREQRESSVKFTHCISVHTGICKQIGR